MLTIKKRPARQESGQATKNPPIAEQQAIDCSSHDDEIRALAFQKWQAAGCPASDGVEFWLAAEAEIVPSRAG